MSNRVRIKQRVYQACEEVWYEQKFVSPIDVLLKGKFLQQAQIEDWRKGRITYLEKVIAGNLNAITFAMKCFREWSCNKGLKPSPTAYLSRTRGSRKELRFSKSGMPSIEMAYRTHYVSPQLIEEQKQKRKEKHEQFVMRIVFRLLIETQCSQCKRLLNIGRFVRVEENQLLCQSCVELSEFVFLPKGDPQLTTSVRELSTKFAIVLQENFVTKTHERQGLLVQPEILERANTVIEINRRAIELKSRKKQKKRPSLHCRILR